jgi:hypothetical protein
MSEVEKKLEGVLTEYAKMDEALKAMYVRLRDLDTISENYHKSKTSLDASAGNLKAASEAVIQEIEVLRDLAKKLTDSQITVFYEKLYSFEVALQRNFEATSQKHQEMNLENKKTSSSILETLQFNQKKLLKNEKASSIILWLMAITVGLLAFEIFVS